MEVVCRIRFPLIEEGQLLEEMKFGIPGKEQILKIGWTDSSTTWIMDVAEN